MSKKKHTGINFFIQLNFGFNKQSYLISRKTHKYCTIKYRTGYWHGVKSNAIELTQYLKPVGCGPSLNIWPKWEPQFWQIISFLFLPWEVSSTVFTWWLIVLEKLGHPLPLLNLVSDENSESLQTVHMYIPLFQWFAYLPVYGASVPLSWQTWYSSLVNFE